MDETTREIDKVTTEKINELSAKWINHERSLIARSLEDINKLHELNSAIIKGCSLIEQYDIISRSNSIQNKYTRDTQTPKALEEQRSEIFTRINEFGSNILKLMSEHKVINSVSDAREQQAKEIVTTFPLELAKEQQKENLKKSEKSVIKNKREYLDKFKEELHDYYEFTDLMQEQSKIVWLNAKIFLDELIELDKKFPDNFKNLDELKNSFQEDFAKLEDKSKEVHEQEKDSQIKIVYNQLKTRIIGTSNNNRQYVEEIEQGVEKCRDDFKKSGLEHETVKNIFDNIGNLVSTPAVNQMLSKDIPDYFKQQNGKFGEIVLEALTDRNEDFDYPPKVVTMGSNLIAKIYADSPDLATDVLEQACKNSSECANGIINFASLLNGFNEKNAVNALDSFIKIKNTSPETKRIFNKEIPKIIKENSKDISELLDLVIENQGIDKNIADIVDTNKLVKISAKKMPRIVNLLNNYRQKNYVRVLKDAALIIADPKVVSFAIVTGISALKGAYSTYQENKRKKKHAKDQAQLIGEGVKNTPTENAQSTGRATWRNSTRSTQSPRGR